MYLVIITRYFFNVDACSLRNIQQVAVFLTLSSAGIVAKVLHFHNPGETAMSIFFS